MLQVTGKEAEYKSILINCWLLCLKKTHFSISKNLKLFVFDCRNRKIPLELKVKTGNFPKARENAGVQITVSVSFASYWFREWREISRPIAERNKAKPEQYRITLDSQMKMALSGTEFSSLVSVIVGATEQPVNTADEVMSCLDSGSAGRQVGTTNMNERSSRSHTIFTLYVGKRKV